MTAPQLDKMVGRTFARLTVEAPAGSDHRGERLWLCRCECGAATTAHGGRLRAGRTRSCGCLHRETVAALCRELGKSGLGGPTVGQAYKAVVGYAAVHARVRVARGKASAHTCPCGSPADQWAYDHTDPAELTEDKPDARLASGFTTVPYSLDIQRYVPMCRSCHVKFDRKA